MALLVAVLAKLLLLLGGFFIFSGAVGMLRFPDFFSRVHASGLTDSIGLPLVLLGVMLHMDFGLGNAKVLLLILFSVITSATAMHALAKASLAANVRPLKGKDAKRLMQQDEE